MKPKEKNKWMDESLFWLALKPKQVEKGKNSKKKAKQFTISNKADQHF